MEQYKALAEILRNKGHREGAEATEAFGKVLFDAGLIPAAVDTTESLSAIDTAQKSETENPIAIELNQRILGRLSDEVTVKALWWGSLASMTKKSRADYAYPEWPDVVKEFHRRERSEISISLSHAMSYEFKIRKGNLYYEVTIGDIRRVAEQELTELKGMGPRRAKFLKTAFKKIEDTAMG